jgi:pyruvate formate lyase activating enzyme
MRTEHAKLRHPGTHPDEAGSGTSLRDRLAEHATPGELAEPVTDRPGWVRCHACGHLCRIPPGRDGICRVRANVDGTLLVPDGYVAALQCDPVEKKPFFHVLPGNLAMSFGMLGCDYHCSYCQNWLTSQSLRDPEAVAPIRAITPEAVIEIAEAHGAPIVVSTYNEPLITSEWAVKIFRQAKERGLLCGYVSNGNATPRVLDYLRPWTDLYKVDLKGFDDRRYRELGGLLSTVLATIENLKARGFWVEVVTLLVPGFNDSDEEVTKICQFLAGVDRDIPWHVTAFRQDYKMTDRSDTEVESLLRAVSIARASGLRYVYAGNRPGRVGSLENTHCPACSALLIERLGYIVRRNRLAGDSCPDCGARIPGVWSRPGAAR